MHVLSRPQVKIPEGLSADLCVHSLLASVPPCILQSHCTPELPTPFSSPWPLPSFTWTPLPCTTLWKWPLGNNLCNCKEPLVFFFTFSGIALPNVQYLKIVVSQALSGFLGKAKPYPYFYCFVRNRSLLIKFKGSFFPPPL